MVNSIHDYFSEKANLNIINRLRERGLNFEITEVEKELLGNSLQGIKILASGKLNHFKRDEIIDFIEANGGQYIKTVSKALDFIIEGEEMGPSKKEKAQKLGIKMISEEEFLSMVGKTIKT